jgi:alkanesulfonate monooxygenase SsuD/methylene tetrahydromethanopterin reductase-like flavin-dependent oxidoreductase (luciferase family)
LPCRSSSPLFSDLELRNLNRLRLTEDYTADILTGGRIIFGVGRGYHTREVETFSSPLLDQNANREMFEEGVDILFKAFAGKPFSHQGKYWTIPPEVSYRGYTLKEITLVPAPERLPVECWQPIQSGSERAFEFMAKYGIRGVIGGGSAEGGAVERHMLGGFLAGRPEDIIEALKAIEKRYPGLDRVICATPLDVQLADLDRFAKEVIPVFRDTQTATAAAAQ